MTNYSLVPKIEEAINEVGGEDEQYKLELKKQVGSALGYSNFVSKMGQMNPGPYNAPSDNPEMLSVTGLDPENAFRGDLTPGAVKQGVNTMMGIRNKEVSHNKSLAKATLAADKKLGKEKEKEKEEEAINEFARIQDKGGDIYEETLSEMIMMNTFGHENQKTYRPEDLQRAMEGLYVAEGFHNEKEAKAAAQNLISKIIPEKYLTDPQGVEKFAYRTQGYTDAEAADLVNTGEYYRGEMSEAREKIFEIKQPGLTTKAKTLKENREFQADYETLLEGGITEGETDYETLVNKYDYIDDKEIKEIVQPMYRVSLYDNIDFNLLRDSEGNVIQELQEAINNPEISFNSLLGVPAVKDFIAEATLLYSGVFGSDDIKKALYDKFYSQK